MSTDKRSAPISLCVSCAFSFALFGCEASEDELLEDEMIEEALLRDANVCATLAPGDNIQAAIDGATAGCTINLENGTWDVTAPITIAKPLILRSKTPRGAKIRAGSLAADPLIRIASDNVVLADLVLTPGWKDTTSVVLQSGGHDNWVVKNCEIKNTPSRGVGWGGIGIYSTGGGAKNVLIEGNSIHHINETGEWGSAIRFHGTSSLANENLYIHNNQISNVGRGGIFTTTNNNRVDVRNNSVHYQLNAVNQDKLAIELWDGSESSVIYNNSVDHWISCDDCYHTGISRNTVGNVSASLRSYVGLENIGGYNNTWTNNAVYGNHAYGFQMSGSRPITNVLIDGNIFYWATGEPASAGLRLYGTQAWFQNILIKNNLFYGNHNALSQTGYVNHVTYYWNTAHDNSLYGRDWSGIWSGNNYPLANNHYNNSLGDHPSCPGCNSSASRPSPVIAHAGTASAGVPTTFYNGTGYGCNGLTGSLWSFESESSAYTPAPNAQAPVTKTFMYAGNYEVKLAAWSSCNVSTLSGSLIQR